MENFVILVGGPGLYAGCDKEHDQTWKNYIVPVQLAVQRNLYNKRPGEVVHWVVYRPPYEQRWHDDSDITWLEDWFQDDGYHLHSKRKEHADEVLGKGAENYLQRIATSAAGLGVKYKGISSPDEFWEYLLSLPDKSISRVWYSGHASKDGLMLSLTHDADTCEAVAEAGDMINVSTISKYSSLKKKLSPTSKQTSKFYGCGTDKFAEKWNSSFGVSAAGAKNKISFDLDRPSTIVDILERIEKTATSVGAPDWTEHR